MVIISSRILLSLLAFWHAYTHIVICYFAEQNRTNKKIVLNNFDRESEKKKSISILMHKMANKFINSYMLMMICEKNTRVYMCVYFFSLSSIRFCVFYFENIDLYLFFFSVRCKINKNARNAVGFYLSF